MRDYLHYDVFTDRLFEGNQLAVFPDARGLSADEMQVLAREMNFSESTFLTPAEVEGTDVRMRIFTPGAELPMAGHPTIGSTFALADGGGIRPGATQIVFGLNVGPTTVELEWAGEQLSFAWMDQRRPESRPPTVPDADLLAALGLDEAARLPGAPLQEVSCGVPFLYVPLASREAVDRAEPDAGALKRVASAFGASHLGFFAFSVEPQGSDVTVYSRMFAPGLGVLEDPATGSATGPLGCYLVTHGLVPPERWLHMVSLQGVRMLRPSRVHMRIHAPAPDRIERVQVGGGCEGGGRGGRRPLTIVD
ncbi:MAG: PhzF family phenazine biosynthesis protein [Vicinamibacterales bacterium]